MNFVNTKSDSVHESTIQLATARGGNLCNTDYDLQKILQQGAPVIAFIKEKNVTNLPKGIGCVMIELSNIQDINARLGHAQGNVVIRDSNVLNYQRLEEHAVDSFDPKLLLPANIKFWIYEKKIVTIPACDRCGDPAGAGVAERLLTDYSCPRCGTSIQRRENYLTFCDGQ